MKNKETYKDTYKGTDRDTDRDTDKDTDKDTGKDTDKDAGQDKDNETATNIMNPSGLWFFVEDLDIPLSDCENIRGFYYQREISNKIGKYRTHIFAFFPDSERQLKKSWETVDSYLGVNYLSEVESEIERSNFYTCYFCQQSIFPALRKQIEKDPYFTKKYIFEQQSWLKNGINPENIGIRENLGPGSESEQAQSRDSMSSGSLSCPVAEIPDRGHTEDSSIASDTQLDIAEKQRKTRAVSEIEQRIFHLDIPESMNKSVSTPKVESLHISNFRAFEGDFSIDFSNQAGNPASFTLIFAPNGTGKTSLIDAVEYALKGEVPRLKTQQKISDASGCIYRNYNAKPGEKAAVEIDFDNGELLHRTVGNVGTTGNDVHIVPVQGKSLEIAGNKSGGQKDNWDRLVLPYDRIDDFLTARTPEQKYKEWCKSVPSLKNEQKRFEELHKEKRHTEISLEKVSVLIEALEKNLLDLTKRRGQAEEIIVSIAKYNKQTTNPEDRLPVLSQKSTSGDYLHVLDEACRILRRLEKEEKSLDEQKEELSSFLNHYAEAKALYEKYEKKKDLQQKQSRVQRRIQSLKKDTTDQNEKLQSIRDQAEDYLLGHSKECTCPVCGAGYSSWNELLLKIKEAGDLSAELNQENLEKLENKLQSLQLQLDAISREIEELAPESEQAFFKGYQLYSEHSKEELDGMYVRLQEEKNKVQASIELLRRIIDNHTAKDYFEKYQQTAKQKEETLRNQEDLTRQLQQLENDFQAAKAHLEHSLQEYFSSAFMNEIYGKINPHETMQSMHYNLGFNEKDEPKLYITMDTGASAAKSVNMPQSYLPEMYFSISQLNTVAFSSFFSRALETTDMYMKTIFIDDPVGNYDDMNILGFVDMIRSIIQNTDCQIIMTTHDESVYDMFSRKLDSRYHSTCFRTLPAGEGITWQKRTS